MMNTSYAHHPLCVTDPGAAADVGEMPDPRRGSQGGAVIDDGARVDHGGDIGIHARS
jgi:hypothetical protein